jgi:parallel beta-helix repeat protein
MLRTLLITFIALLIWLMPIDGARTYIVDDNGFADYRTIGEAVVAASNGDTIYLKPGIYNEEVVLDKSLNLTTLTGETEPIVLDGKGLKKGILITVDNCSIEGLTLINFNASGIEIRSNGNIIRNNKFVNDRPGILVVSSFSNMIEKNTIEDCFAGIALYARSKDNNVTGNDLRRGTISFLLNYAEHNKIANNSLYESKTGFEITNSSNVELIGNQIEGAAIGIRAFNSSNCVFVGNKARGTIYCGISVVNDSRGLEIINNTISDSERGLFMDNSNGCKIVGCKFENIIAALQVVAGSYNNITDNSIKNSVDSAIELAYANSNVIERNAISKSERGITIYQSSRNSLRNNILKDVNSALYVESSIKEGYNNSIDESNILNGRPIIYFYDQSGKVIQNRELSYLTLAYCENFTVQKNNINSGVIFLINSSKNNIFGNNVSNCLGVRLDYSKANNLSGNKIIGNKYSGLFLVGSESNEISSNEASKNNQMGISLLVSNANIVRNNSFDANHEAGIWIDTSSDNKIYDNIVSNNSIGLQVTNSTGNLIYHNNIINNQEQAEDRMGNNTWDMGKEIGGNYWSDQRAKGNPSTISKLIKGTKKDNFPFQDINGWLFAKTK